MGALLTDGCRMLHYSGHGFSYLDRGRRYEMRVRSLTFYTSLHELRVGDGDGAFARVAVPEDANVGTFADQLLVSLRSPCSW